MVLNSHRWKTHNKAQQGAKPLKPNENVVDDHHHRHDNYDDCNVYEDINKIKMLFFLFLIVAAKPLKNNKSVVDNQISIIMKMIAMFYEKGLFSVHIL